MKGYKPFENIKYTLKFEICTDCAAFSQAVFKKDLTFKIARWALPMGEIDFEITYRPASQMNNAVL